MESLYKDVQYRLGRRNAIDSGMDVLKIDDYPQLALLSWNRAERTITGEEALGLYEREWRFVDVDHLTPLERALIERLKKQYGHGVLNV